DHVATGEQRLGEAAQLLGGTPAETSDKLRALLDRQKKLERELESLKARAASGATADLASGAVEVEGIKVLAARLEGFDAKALREAVDRFKQQLGDTVVVLAGASGGKAALVAGVGGAALKRIKAGELLAYIAGQIGGKGGGRPDLAQGGGEDGPALVEALDGGDGRAGGSGPRGGRRGGAGRAGREGAWRTPLRRLYSCPSPRPLRPLRLLGSDGGVGPGTPRAEKDSLFGAQTENGRPGP